MRLIIENLTIEGLHIHSGMPAMASALFASLVPAADEPEAAAPTAASQNPAGRPAIGEYWEGQGGIYAGDFRGDDGVVFGLIIGAEQDIGTARWAPEGERDLSDWDGLANTQRLRNECPAAKLAAEYERDEHSNFYLPARRELQLAGANLQHLFGKASWYWTSTPYSKGYAWAVGFEDGSTRNCCHRSNEFRVRPFRSFKLSDE